MGPGIRLALALGTFGVLICLATLGYVLLEGFHFLEALYMTVITVTTVGFKEVHPLGGDGQILTIVVTLIGVALVAISVGSLTEVLVTGSVMRLMGRRRMLKHIDALSGHFIICGFGRIGHLIGRDLNAHGVPYVVIDTDPGMLAQEEGHEHILFIDGDATEDESLIRAGIQRARGLVAALPSDAHNVFVTMSARELAPGLLILARAAEEGSERKLKRAGADRVVSPYEIGARRMAQAILRPSVMDFIELVTTSPEKGAMQLAEVRLQADSDLVGKSLIESEIRSRHAAFVVALKKSGGKMTMNPPPGEVMQAGDVLILIGPSEKLLDLEQRASGNA